jgi:hypothetical protein
MNEQTRAATALVGKIVAAESGAEARSYAVALAILLDKADRLEAAVDAEAFDEKYARVTEALQASELLDRLADDITRRVTRSLTAAQRRGGRH